MGILEVSLNLKDVTADILNNFGMSVQTCNHKQSFDQFFFLVFVFQTQRNWYILNVVVKIFPQPYTSLHVLTSSYLIHLLITLIFN